MGKKYTITLVVEDVNSEYGDAFTLDHYFTDTVGSVTFALGLSIVSIDVKGKRN